MVLCLSALALVASSQVIHPYRSLPTGNAVVMSTSDFNPQISTRNEWVPQVLTENEGLPTLAVGPSNSLKAGSVTSTKRGNAGSKFPGITFTGWVPPDPDMAVGPDYVVTTVNSDLAFFRKSDGAKVFQQTMDGSGFFSGIGVTSNFTFDPKCFYDKLSGRFFVLICEQSDSPQVSKALLAVSDDSNPNGTWFKYRIETASDDGSGNHWLDYPGFGFNKDAIVITGNMFPFASGGVFTQFAVIPKTPLLTGASATVQYLRDATMFTVQPSRTADSTQANVYGATALNTTTIRLVAITNPGGGAALVKKDVAVPAWVRPSAVPVNGGRFLDGLDGRLYNCHFRAGRVVTAHTTKAGDGRMKVRWYEFNVNTWPVSGNPTLKQSGDILLSGTNTHMPAINTNTAGDISIIYTRCNASTNPETVQSSRFAVDPLGQIGAPVSLQLSSGLYGGSGTNRWGDYFACEVDPNDNLTFWGIGMVAGAGGAWITTFHKWTVSSGTGEDTLVAPGAVSTIQGTPITGDLATISSSDNNRYTIQSYFIDKFGDPVGPNGTPTAQVASFQADFDLDMSQGTLQDLKAVLEANANTTGVSAQVFAWNWGTGTFTLVGSVALGTTDKVNTVSIPKSALSSYVDGTGNVRLLVRAIYPLRNGRPNRIPPQFLFNTDRVAVSPSFGS